VPPDVVALRRAIVHVSADPGTPSISLQQHFSTEDAPPAYSARVQSSVVFKEDELVETDRPRKITAAIAAMLTALQELRLAAEGAPMPPDEQGGGPG